MEPAGVGSVGELLTFLAATLGSVLLTGGGLFIEYTALQSVSTDHLVLGAWEAGMGMIVLVAGAYMLGYGTVLPRLRQLRRA